MTVTNPGEPEIHISEEKLQRLRLDTFESGCDFHDYRCPGFPIG